MIFPRRKKTPAVVKSGALRQEGGHSRLSKRAILISIQFPLLFAEDVNVDPGIGLAHCPAAGEYK